MPYEDILSKVSFMRLADMYLEAGNPQMADKVSFYESALDGELFVYHINRHGHSVGIDFSRRGYELTLVAADVGVGELDEVVNASLTMLCAKRGVSESMLKMKLELKGNMVT